MMLPNLNTQVPKSDHDLVIWLVIIIVASILMGFRWVGKIVYPKWAKKQEELELLRINSIVKVCEQTSSIIEEHAKQDQELFSSIVEELRGIKTNQELLVHNMQMRDDLEKLKEEIVQLGNKNE